MNIVNFNNEWKNILDFSIIHVVTKNNKFDWCRRHLICIDLLLSNIIVFFKTINSMMTDGPLMFQRSLSSLAL